MTTNTEVKKAIVDGLVRRVVDDATGASFPPLQRYSGPPPDSEFWLGTLAPESTTQVEGRSRASIERFRPSSEGFRFRVRALPLDVELSVSFAVWVALHPTLEEQRRGAGLEAVDDDEEEPAHPHPAGRERGQRLARIRAKVPVRRDSLRMTLESTGRRTVGTADIMRAVEEGLGRLPGALVPFRPLGRGGANPRSGDLRDDSSWSAWERGNLDDPALPMWRAAVDVEVSGPAAGPFEVLITIVNRTPEEQFVDEDGSRAFPKWALDPTLYEVELACEPSVPPLPYELAEIPRSYRYDRRVPALGENAAVEPVDRMFRTAFAGVAETDRLYPRTEAMDGIRLDTSFATLKADPVPALRRLMAEAERWTESNWGTVALETRAAADGWGEETREEARADAADVLEELEWVRAGMRMLEEDPDLLEAFRLMNETMEIVAGNRYTSWHPFQLAFITGCLPGIRDPQSAPTVDILWFSTGGGKTEAYLGLNIVELFYGRLTGRMAGAQTWARFPLRLLSLQQTQRIADSVILAELVRLRHPRTRDGEPFAVGYYVGAGNTPNKVVLPGSSYYEGWDPFDSERAESCRVLERCPACGGPDRPAVRFDEDTHTMIHECLNDACPLPWDRLPVYVIDDDIYRWAPSVIVGTVDKLAMLGQQADFRILLGRALSRCPKHGYSAYLDRCGVYGCREALRPVPKGFGGLSLEVQDELHLLSESLGALDGNYETLFQAVADASGSSGIRTIGATATIEGYVDQARHLYHRAPRRFPVPGPTKTESFWAFEQAGDPLRTYAALLPRGTTMLNAAFFVTRSHWRFIQEGLRDPEFFCRDALALDPSLGDEVAGYLRDLYEVMVTYALRKQDLERYAKDIAEDAEICPDGGNYDSITGDVEFWDVRSVLDRLEAPPGSPADRIRVLGATSAISHGVDVVRLNVMTVMGMPKQTSEFIQATARVGRQNPGVVFALINPMRERDVSHFRYFRKYAEYLDRLVEPVPVNRESLPVLKRVLPGGLMAWLLQVDEPEWLYPGGTVPRRRRDRLWFVKGVAAAIDDGFVSEPELGERLLRSFAVDAADPRFERHREAIRQFVTSNVSSILLRRGSGEATIKEIDPPPPRSLRDLETPIEIRGER